MIGERAWLATAITDLFFVDVNKPTKSIEIKLLLEDGLSCEDPKVKMAAIDEVMLQNLDTDDISEKLKFENKTKQERVLTIKYPPMGTRYAVAINVFPRARRPDHS
jgi:hypothetical protein